MNGDFFQVAASFTGAVQKEHQRPAFPGLHIIGLWQEEQVLGADGFGNFPFEALWFLHGVVGSVPGKGEGERQKAGASHCDESCLHDDCSFRFGREWQAGMDWGCSSDLVRSAWDLFTP